MKRSIYQIFIFIGILAGFTIMGAYGFAAGGTALGLVLVHPLYKNRNTTNITAYRGVIFLGILTCFAIVDHYGLVAGGIALCVVIAHPVYRFFRNLLTSLK